MKMTTKQLTASAIFAALIFVITRVVQIPIPLGYLNIGNSFILACCVLVPSPAGIYAGAIGSALADLTSYPAYTIPTLIIKSLMPLVFYLICRLPWKKTWLKQMTAALISTLIPLFGYTLTGCFLYGGFAAGMAQFPGLLIEYAANAVIFAAFLSVFTKAGIRPM